MTNDNETTGARLTDARQKRRIPDVEARQMGDDARWYCHHTSNTIGMRLGRFIRRLLIERADLLANRAALVKDNATLLSQRDDAWSRHMQAESRIAALVAENARLEDVARSMAFRATALEDHITAWERRTIVAEAREAAMRPLVEALARSNVHRGWNGSWFCDSCRGTGMLATDVAHAPGCPAQTARALAATWAAGQTPAAPDTAATAANRQRYPHFGLVWTVIDAVAAGDNERARAYADLLADHLDADNYPYEAKRIRNRLSPDYDPGPLLYLMAETPAAPTPLPTRYRRTEDGGIESAPGGLLYTADCNFTEAEWVALLTLLNEGYDGLTWEEIEPLVAERIEANVAPTPDGQEGGAG